MFLSQNLLLTYRIFGDPSQAQQLRLFQEFFKTLKTTFIMFNTTFIMKLYALKTTFIMFQKNKKTFVCISRIFIVLLQCFLITTCLMFLNICI